MNERSSQDVSARCYCGAVALHSTAAAQSVVNCHCGQCRRLSGAAYTTWVSLAKHEVQQIGTDNLVAFNATSNVTRHFCKVCGSHVFTVDKRHPKIMGVPAGVIESQLPSQPKAHYFVSHMAAWHAVSDGLPQFGGESGVEPMHPKLRHEP
jgi:hypothetical protein